MTARWSLVSTMHGLPETILPCIAHHLRSDAELLHIYLDAPNPVVEAALATQPKCRVTVCDDAYWHEVHGARPAKIVARQLANLRHARNCARSEWMVHIDSDEFLVNTDDDAPVTLATLLDETPKDHDWFRILPMERVLTDRAAMQSIFDGVFRATTRNPEIVTRAYGPAAKYLFHGLSGHSHGKIGFRVDTAHEVRLHRVMFSDHINRKPKPGPADLPPFRVVETVKLLHFDGWTPLHWTMKLKRLAQTGDYKKASPGRKESVEFMKRSQQESIQNSLFLSVQTLSEQGLRTLTKAGLIRDIRFDPTELCKSTFPEVPFDFSPEFFEEKLREQSR